MDNSPKTNPLLSRLLYQYLKEIRKKAFLSLGIITTGIEKQMEKGNLNQISLLLHFLPLF
jgi:hypothetical protein